MQTIDNVNNMTNIAGTNELQLLAFELADGEQYAINIFKVVEVLKIKKSDIENAPKKSPAFIGVLPFRGETHFILDLSVAMGITEPDSHLDGEDDGFVIITEVNQRVIGYLVKTVVNVNNKTWEETTAPKEMEELTDNIVYITELNDRTARVVDIEKIYEDQSGATTISEEEANSKISGRLGYNILVVDDSSVARKQIKKTVEQVGCHHTTFKNGKEAWDFLTEFRDRHVEAGTNIKDELQIVITDIEMPELDGYTLTKKIKEDGVLKELYVIIQSSIGQSLTAGVLQSVKADQFLTKWDPSVLSEYIKAYKG